MSKMYWPPSAPLALLVHPSSPSAKPSKASRPSSIALNTSIRSTASSSTTIPKPPTSMPRPRLSPLSPPAFTSSWVAKTRTLTTPSSRNCCARMFALFTPSARQRPKSNRICVEWSRSIPAKRLTRQSTPRQRRRAPAKWSCSRLPAPALTSSKATSTAAASLKNSSTNGGGGRFGKTYRGRQVDLLHHAAARRCRPGHGVLRLSRRRTRALPLAVCVRGPSSRLGRRRPGHHDHSHERGVHPLQFAALHLSRRSRYHHAPCAGLLFSRLAQYPSLDSLRWPLHLPAF